MSSQFSCFVNLCFFASNARKSKIGVFSHMADFLGQFRLDSNLWHRLSESVYRGPMNSTHPTRHPLLPASSAGRRPRLTGIACSPSPVPAPTPGAHAVRSGPVPLPTATNPLPHARTPGDRLHTEALQVSGTDRFGAGCGSHEVGEERLIVVHWRLALWWGGVIRRMESC